MRITDHNQLGIRGEFSSLYIDLRINKINTLIIVAIIKGKFAIDIYSTVNIFIFSVQLTFFIVHYTVDGQLTGGINSQCTSAHFNTTVKVTN